MGQYNPQKVFRQTSNSLLREFFESKGHQLDIEWKQLHETQIQSIYDAFLVLPDAEWRELELMA